MGVDEIIRMADEADDYADSVIQMPGEYHPDWHTVRDERFAALVAEATKEKMKKVFAVATPKSTWTTDRIIAEIEDMK